MEEFDIPHDFLCPIGQQIMADPVTTADGHTYERDNIEEWLFHQDKDTNPLTNAKLPSKVLTPVTSPKSLARVKTVWAMSFIWVEKMAQALSTRTWKTSSGLCFSAFAEHECCVGP